RVIMQQIGIHRDGLSERFLPPLHLPAMFFLEHAPPGLRHGHVNLMSLTEQFLNQTQGVGSAARARHSNHQSLHPRITSTIANRKTTTLIIPFIVKNAVLSRDKSSGETIRCS